MKRSLEHAFEHFESQRQLYKTHYISLRCHQLLYRLRLASTCTWKTELQTFERIVDSEDANYIFPHVWHQAWLFFTACKTPDVVENITMKIMPFIHDPEVLGDGSMQIMRHADGDILQRPIFAQLCSRGPVIRSGHFSDKPCESIAEQYIKAHFKALTEAFVDDLTFILGQKEIGFIICGYLDWPVHVCDISLSME